MSNDRRGIVLVVVLFFALLLSSTVATFLRKATIDAMIVRNRENRARADALARGGVQLATALLVEDKFRDVQSPSGLSLNHLDEPWAQLGRQEIALEGGTSLRLQIEDAGAKLNLNAVVSFDESGNPNPLAEALLTELFEKMIEEIPLPPGEKFYDVPELVGDLIDYIDADDLRIRGGAEDDLYQSLDPPYRASNRPLLSVDELRRVYGFDAKLVDALRPYVTVYPYAGGGGINPNTAPPHVLALLFFDDGVDLRTAPEDTIREILSIRDEGGQVCGEDQSGESCTPIREIVVNAIYPSPSYSSEVFVVRAIAQAGEIRRTLEAVIDRREAANPLLLSWRVL